MSPVKRKKKPTKAELLASRYKFWTSSEDSSSDDDAIEVYRPTRGRPRLLVNHPEMFEAPPRALPAGNEASQIGQGQDSKALSKKPTDETDTRHRDESEEHVVPTYQLPGVEHEFSVDPDESLGHEDEYGDDIENSATHEVELNLDEYFAPNGWTYDVADSHACSDVDFDNPPPATVSDVEHLLLPQQDLDGGLRIAQEVARLADNFQVKLLRLFTDHQSITKEFKSEMLKAIKSVKPVDVENLPVDQRALMKSIPLNSLSCWITHICMECKKSNTYKYHVYQRNRLEFPMCHKQLDYYSDHYLVTDVSEVLALVLPSIWQWRSEEYLPPYIKKVMAENGMDFQTDITLSVSSDGVQFFKSSSLSVWPILAYIDGIPYHLQRRTILFLGALAARGVGKYFQVNLMIEDFTKQIERLNKTTFSWILDGKVMKSRVLVSRVIADSPARASLQGVMNFNGVFGCNYCYHCQSGAYFMHFERPSVLRTDEHIRGTYAKENFESLSVHDKYGVRWKSSFARIPFDLVDGFPPDVMHAVHAGVMKLLIQQWLSGPARDDDDKLAKRRPFQLSQRQKDILDARLLNIRPPERTSRRPRKLTNVGMWKAHELSMFLSHYGPIILRDILPPEYYDHYIDLVAGIALLSSKITPEHVAEAQGYLDRFSENIHRLYTPECRRFNVHLLRHLPRFCELHGILPLFSMYPFESENHTLGTYVNDHHAVVVQLYQKSMQNLILNCREDTFTKDFSKKGWLEWECPYEYMDYSEIRNLQARSEGTAYYQVYHPPGGKPRLVSKSYTALQHRNGYMVMLGTNRVGSILKFFVGRSNEEILAIVEEFEVSKHDVLGHIRYLERNLGKCVIPVRSFMEQVVEVEFNGRVAYALYLNNIEHVAE